MVLINTSGFIGEAIVNFNGITGSLFLTLFLLLIVLLVVALALRIPIEAISIIFLPLLIVLSIESGEFLAIFGVGLIYIGVIVGKYLLK